VPRISRKSAARADAIQGLFESHSDELEGYNVSFDKYDQDLDMTPLFKGLPDDRCQCPHWGYVLKGKVGYRYADREEIIEEGEAYYAPPGHTRQLYAGSEVIEFSPKGELQKTIDVVTRNMKAQERAA
jgi:hypothetical protein